MSAVLVSSCPSSVVCLRLSSWMACHHLYCCSLWKSMSSVVVYHYLSWMAVPLWLDLWNSREVIKFPTLVVTSLAEVRALSLIIRPTVHTCYIVSPGSYLATSGLYEQPTVDCRKMRHICSTMPFQLFPHTSVKNIHATWHTCRPYSTVETWVHEVKNLCRFTTNVSFC